MQRFYGLMAAALLVAGVAAPADAVVNYLSIDWTGATKTVNFTIAGTSITGAGIAVAKGNLDEVYDLANSAGGKTLNRLFCIDVFQFAYDATATNNFEWDVHHYTQADGTTGWTTPVGDTDRWRDQGSVKKAGFLVNKWARGSWLATGTSTQKYDKTIALNVAVWKAAYGNRFNLTSGTGGLTTAQKSYYDLYMVDYTAGREASQYSWYDSNYWDTDDRYQDFIEPVPEPGTILLLGSGLLGSGLLVRRRRS